MTGSPHDAAKVSDSVERVNFTGRITQLLPGGRGGFVTFDEPMRAASRGYFRASLLGGYAVLEKPGARVEGIALVNGAVVAEVLQLDMQPSE